MDEQWIARLQGLRSRWLPLLLATIAPIMLGITSTPENLIESLEQAQFAIAHGNDAAAADALGQVLLWTDHQPQLRLQAATFNLNANRPSHALQLLEGREQSDIEGAECIRLQALVALANPTEAQKLLTDYPTTCSLPVSTVEHLAQRALQDEDPEAALFLYRELQKIEPDNRSHWRQAAITQSILEPNSAVEPLRQFLQDSPEPDPLVQNLIRAIETAEVEEDLAFTFARVGQTFMQQQGWLEASLALRRAIDQDPAYYEAHAYLGLSLEMLGLDGLAHLELAHDQAPTAPLPASLLSQHWLHEGEPQRALIYGEIAQNAQPQNPAYRAQLGSIFEAMGDLQAAREHYQAAVQFSGGSAEFWQLLANFFITNEINIEAEGLTTARQAYRLDPSGRTADLLGYAHLLAGEQAVAQKLLKQAIQLEPELASAHFHYGLALVESGQPELAIAHFSRTQELDSEGVWGRLASRTLERIELQP